MNRYEWQNDSAVAQVAIRRDQAYPTAYVVASDHADAQLFARLPQQLRSLGMTCVADTFEGKPALRVIGFEKDAQIVGALSHHGYVQDIPKLTEREPDKPFHLGEFLKDNSVQAAGITYLFADGMAYLSGMLRGDNDNKMMGLFFAGTSVLLVGLGTPDPKRQMQRLYEKMDEHFAHEDQRLSDQDHVALHQRMGDRGLVWRMSNFLSDHLVTVNNLGQGVGGYFGLRAGMKQGAGSGDNVKANPFKVASGISIMTGQWGALAIDEQQTAGMNPEERAAFLRAQRNGEKPEMKDINPLANPGDWLKQKPLRLTGLGAGLHNVLTFSSGIWEYMQIKSGKGEFQSKRGAYLDMGAQVVNLAANTLYGLSPKDRGGELKAEGYVDELVSTAAQIYGALEPEARAERISSFAGYMSSIPEMRSSAQELYDKVTAKIEALEKGNPWYAADKVNHTRPDTHIHARGEPVIERVEPQNLAIL